MNRLGYAMGQRAIRARGEVETTSFSLLDREWIQFGDVFAGESKLASTLFTSWLPLTAGTSFLEMGCGSGVTAVMAALHGCAPVTAVDINPSAVDNVRANAERHGVGDKVRALRSDLFKSLDAHDKFDIIYWNSPFVESPADNTSPSYAEAAVFDPGYTAHREFLRTAPDHLTDSGTVYLGYSRIAGNIGLLEQFAESAGLTCEVYQENVFDIPHERLGTDPVFAEHADEAGHLRCDCTLLAFRRR
ncbi:methyltransferase [Streptomyces sp. I05A-00742]|uniref:methyltransferase n=1 Tax=Streptomyces sp. I05A-00742 TaxID=2732853 RepID=UPI001488E182|nr:methyltransferase [Streptomyces sp. I05A-00742]